MSLLNEQAAFLKDVRTLLAFADEQQWVVTGGELERPPETQAIYVRDGREKTMDSPHVRKCAIWLNFFRANGDRFEVAENAAALETVGAKWEDLDPRNRWGGRRGGTLEAGRFWRELGAWPSSQVSTLQPPAEAQPTADAPAQADSERPQPVVLGTSSSTSSTPVLKPGTQERDAVAKLQALLVARGFLPTERATGLYDEFTINAVKDFQRKNNLVADGIVGDKSWTTLNSQTGDAQAAMASRFIGDADFVNAANALGIEPAALKAVYKVESNGKGFVGDKPKILFEGQVFWRQLQAHGLRPETMQRGNEDILYPKWTKAHYVGGAGEHTRLDRAKVLHPEAALESASWGLFQIMGFHWQKMKYASVHEYVEAMARHERDQLDAFCRFAKSESFRGRTLVDMLRDKDWTAFAFKYNGEGYRQNAYDDKLRDQYRRALAQG